MIKIYISAILIVFGGVAAWADAHKSADDDTETFELSLNAEDVDLEAAEAIFTKSCRACHGNKAQGVASYPKLTDKEPEHIADRLVTYRARERVGPNSALMFQPAKKLSDEDIAGLAVYVTSAFD